MKSAIGSPGIETHHIQESVFQLNSRFQGCALAAQRWEQELENALQLWIEFGDCERAVVHWLEMAGKMLKENPSDSKYRKDVHKVCFITGTLS